MPSVGSLFSGAGGFDLGFEAAGYDVAWQVEIDKDAVSVLERHWPDVPRWRDVSEVDPADLAPVDVVIFGSPCQDFSVAGKRAGLDGARSGLFGEAIRIISGLRPTPAFCLWENVPGALSSAGGRDFGAVLDALADIGALDIAWRVLDARHFGVPQRRRRVFLVADFGAERAGQVLFESEGGGGDSAPGGAAREGSPGDAEDGAGVVGWMESQSGTRVSGLVGTLDANYGSRRHNGDAVVPDFVRQAVSSKWSKGSSGPAGDEYHNWQKGDGGADESFRGKSRSYIVRAGDYAGSVSSTKHDAVAFHLTQDPINGAESPALGAGNAHGCSSIAVATWDERNVTSPTNRNRVEYGKAADTLHAEGTATVTPMAVRRLTPRETERLQGWADDWTRWRANGDEISDGPRYRMVGNGVASPVAAWVARRMRAALEATP